MNFGQAIAYDSSGNGTPVITINQTPATDTVGLTVKNASLKSVLDSTGTAIAFNPKHGFVVSQPGVYTLNLGNLSEKYIVTLTAQALKGDKNDGDAQPQEFHPVAPKQASTSRSTNTTSEQGSN